MIKPPYHVPSMSEIEEVEPNGLSIVSTFSGCGGSCLGFRMAGYNVLYANEFVPAAQDTYRANHPETYLDTRDIRTVTATDILDIVKKDVGEIDVLEGSPPCSSFSTSGKREDGWGKENAYSDTAQRTDDLFFEYVRLLGDLKPRAFVAENVSGLIKGASKGYFKMIVRAMKERGYRVNAQLLNAQWLGVPQSRQRVIFMGIRDDLDRDPVFPTPLPYRYSVRDVAPLVERVKHGGAPDNWKSSDLPSPTIVASGAIRSKTAYLSGGTWVYARNEQTDKIEMRKFTIDEVRRLCSFPDDFILTGKYEQQWERLGRSVPPLMMKAVATSLASVLQGDSQ